MKGTDRTFIYLVSVQRVCGSTPLNLTHAWWYTLRPRVANRQWHPATPFGDSAVTWALPKPLFGLMGDCFIYLLIIKSYCNLGREQEGLVIDEKAAKKLKKSIKLRLSVSSSSEPVVLAEPSVQPPYPQLGRLTTGENSSTPPPHHFLFTRYHPPNQRIKIQGIQITHLLL